MPPALENGDVGIDFCAMALRDTFGDPYNVSHFLLLQLDVGVEHTKVELLHERIQVELNLSKKERFL